jgi:predicted ArsR family transcriptional regulator
MTVLWELKLAKPGGIASHLRLSFDLNVSVKRVRILLARLEELGYVRSGKGPRLGRGRPSLLYAPALARDEALRQQLEKFLEDYILDRSALALILTD